ncbi:MAG TPA: hypothetical protein VI636_21620 [Candidatus Angelobacter sp.]
MLLLLSCSFDLLGAGLRFLDHTRGLVAVLCGHLPMTALHFFMADIEFGCAGLMLRNLCGFGAAETLALHFLADLLVARAGSVQIILAVAFNLRRSFGARFNVVAQWLQTE